MTFTKVQLDAALDTALAVRAKQCVGIITEIRKQYEATAYSGTADKRYTASLRVGIQMLDEAERCIKKEFGL